MKKFFSYIEIFSIALNIFLLPIDRFPYLHQLPFRLGFISFTLLVLAGMSRLAQIGYNKRWIDLKRISLIGLLLLLPVAAYAQSIIYALDRPLATGATKLLLVVALKAWFFFILIYSDKSLWRVVRWSVYTITALVVAFGFFQFIFDVLGASTKITDLRSCCTSNSTYVFPRVHSVSIEPLYFAHFLLLPLWLMVWDFLNNRELRKNKLLIALFIATSTLFLLSLARSAILGFVVSLAVFGAAVRGRAIIRQMRPYIIKIIGGVVLIAIFFVVASGLASHFIHKSAINGSDAGVKGNLAIFSSHAVAVADESAQTRYSTWPKSLHYIKEDPLKGVGAYNSRVRLNLSEYKNGVQDIKLQPFNNDLIGLLVDLGLIGVVSFTPLLIALTKSIIRSFRSMWRTPSAPFALATIAMLVQSNFFQSILLARLWVVVGIALIGLYELPTDNKKRA